ncbi:YxeA family protein [Paenibacillus larvae]
MRKYTAYIGIFLVVVVMLTGCDFNRMFKDQVYTQIKGEGQLVGDRYEYTLPAYNEKGEEIQLTFYKFGEDRFKQDAYLRLYVKGKDGKKEVTSYEEVKKEELPNKVKEKLHITP